MRVSAPANLDDFSRASDPLSLMDAWENMISSQLNRRAANTRRFFHPFKPPNDTPIVEADPVTWTGFPRAVELFAGSLEDESKLPEAYRIAEVARPVYYALVNGDLDLVGDRSRYPTGPKPAIDGIVQIGEPDIIFQERQQDEYLEWKVIRSAGKVTRMMFTAEGPEYWRTLAQDPELLTTLYNELLFDGRDVVARQDLYWDHEIAVPSYSERRLSDGTVVTELDRERDGRTRYVALGAKGTYNQWNKWNTTDGCVHLIQRNNSLGAEINLAADSTYEYATSSLAVDAEAFMTCAAIGGIRRNSDPNIARDVNQSVLGGLAVTIANPIGLYMSVFPTAEIIHDGVDVTDQILTGIRGGLGGNRQTVVRFELRAPADGAFTLEECTFNGQRLNTGGPIARATSISIYANGVVTDRPNIPRDCAFSALCEHPDISGFKSFPVAGQCALVDWKNVVPHTGGAALENDTITPIPAGSSQPTNVLSESMRMDAVRRRDTDG